MTRDSLWPASRWPGTPSAASERPLAWWSPAQLSQFAERIAPAWQHWCDDWGLGAGPVDAFNAAQTPSSLSGPAGWQPLAGAAPGVAWLGFMAGEPAAVIVTLLFGLQASAPGDAEASSIADEVAAKAVQAPHRVLADALSGCVPPRRLPASAPVEAPPQRDARSWSGAVRVLARFGGTQRGVWLHLSPECAFGWANADTALKCRERTATGPRRCAAASPRPAPRR
jgi:hypothetical protein